MPRDGERQDAGEDHGSREPAGRRAANGSGLPEIDPELKAALRPWVDVDEVGWVGLRTWLLAVLPLVPRPGRGDRVLDRDVSGAPAKDRMPLLAKALAECASDRAQAHFQAAEYFRENRVLARRVEALEAVVRTRTKAGQLPAVDLTDPEAEAAVHRYLPPEGR